MRSLATRDAGSEISKALPDAIAACKAAGFDLVVVETSGIGQGDAAIVPLVDVSLYVMTPEFGAAIAAREDRHARLRRLRRHQQVRPQGRRRRAARRAQAVPAQPRALAATRPTTMPVFGTMASRFNDDGVTALYQALAARLAEQRPEARARASSRPSRRRHSTGQNVDRARARACATSPRSPRRVRAYHRWAARAGDASPASGSSCATAKRDARGRVQGPGAAGDPKAPRWTAVDRRRSTAWPPSATAKLDAAREEAPRRCGRRPRRPTAATSTW